MTGSAYTLNTRC